MRRFVTPANTIIVQCKHYAGSRYSALLSELRTKELPKICRLKPTRYILTTSIGLTPTNKAQLHQLLAPYCKSQADIYGREDLNNLLGKFPDVERQHLKLWISSTSVLESIIHSQIINTSAEEIEKIQRRSRLYVHNPSFPEALNILAKQNFCIIAGIPGIGKTTLAEMLVLFYLQNGYELVRITSNIQEASSLHGHSKKRIYYYDDFLGQSSDADKFAKNEDQRLLDFLETTRNSKFNKLILTTREYILNQAQLRYERFSRINLKLETCIVDLQKYTRLNKGQILFNHLYFSDLPDEFKHRLLSSGAYLKIIDHKNYSPRFIELLTKNSTVVGMPPDEYASYFIAKLSHPAELWEHAFRRQLGQAARNILIVLTSMPRQAALDDLRVAFDRYHAARCHHFSLPMDPSDFMDGCRELDGNFVSYTRTYGRNYVTFHNPSIRDFLQSFCTGAGMEMELMLENAVYFEQLLWMAAFKLPNSKQLEFRSFLTKRSGMFVNALERSIGSPSCMTETINIHSYSGFRVETRAIESSFEDRVLDLIRIRNNFPIEELSQFVSRCIEQIIKRCEDDEPEIEEIIKIIEEMSEKMIEENGSLLDAADDLLSSRLDNVANYHLLIRFMACCPERFKEEREKHLANKFTRFLNEDMDNWYNGTETDDADEFRSCARKLEEVANILCINVDDELEKIKDQAVEKEVEADNSRPEPDYDEQRPDPEATDSELASLFSAMSVSQSA